MKSEEQIKEAIKTLQECKDIFEVGNTRDETQTQLLLGCYLNALRWVIGRQVAD